MLESTPGIKLSNKEFEQLRVFIYKECGINLSLPKKTLLESRLQKRLSQLRLRSFAEYYDFVTGPYGKQDELIQMIDAVATNKTDFFREPVHFQFMDEEVLPWLIGEGFSKSVKIWSAACSTGEEPYTIAMVMEEFATEHRMDYKITATDISTKALEKAQLAIYPERLISAVPIPLRKKYMLRSKDTLNPTIRMIPKLRGKVNFKRLNFMDDVLDVDYDYDIIFCRNVLIYFDRKTQEQVVEKLLAHLKTGGYLFIGHSESIYQMDLPVRQLKPTIFQKI